MDEQFLNDLQFAKAAAEKMAREQDPAIEKKYAELEEFYNQNIATKINALCALPKKDKKYFAVNLKRHRLTDTDIVWIEIELTHKNDSLISRFRHTPENVICMMISEPNNITLGSSPIQNDAVIPGTQIQKANCDAAAALGCLIAWISAIAPDRLNELAATEKRLTITKAVPAPSPDRLNGPC